MTGDDELFNNAAQRAGVAIRDRAHRVAAGCRSGQPRRCYDADASPRLRPDGGVTPESQTAASGTLPRGSGTATQDANRPNPPA